MKYFNQLAIGIMAVSSLSSCVTVSPDGVKRVEFNKVVVSGERTREGVAWLIKPDCSMQSIPTVRVVEPPKHGKLVIVKESVFPTTAKGIYSKCKAVKVQGSVGYYTSDKGYLGMDSLTVRVSYGNGRIEDSVLNIKVVK